MDSFKVKLTHLDQRVLMMNHWDLKFLRSVIGSLVYLTNYCTRPNIAFRVSLLVRHNVNLTRRYWAGIKTSVVFFIVSFLKFIAVFIK